MSDFSDSDDGYSTLHEWSHPVDSDPGSAVDLSSVPHVDVSALDASLHHVDDHVEHVDDQGHHLDGHGLPVVADAGLDYAGHDGSPEWAGSAAGDSGIATDGASDHPLIYPPAVPAQFQSQSDDPIVNIYDSVDNGMAGDASSLWALAYPGQPWPYDGQQPEEPTQLMEHVVGDTTVPEAVRQTADNWLTANGVDLNITAAPTNTVWDVTNSVTVPVSDESPVTVPVSDTAPATQPATQPAHTDPSNTQPADTQPADHTANPTTDPTSQADPSAQASDPDLANPDVQQDLKYWFYQDTNHTCEPSSATEIINEFTGTHYANENTVADYAQKQGWLSDNGMEFDKLPTLFAHFGVSASEQSGGSSQQEALATLARTVDDEHKSVVMSVNAPEYWYADHGKSEGGPELHAVRIVDVDLAHGTAILSDTGDPKGQGSVVQLSDLMKAWAEGTDSTGTGYPMVVTSAVDPAYADADSPATHSSADPGANPVPETPTSTTSTTPTTTPSTTPSTTPTTPTTPATPSSPGHTPPISMQPLAGNPAAATGPASTSGHEARNIVEFVILPITVGIGMAARSLRR